MGCVLRIFPSSIITLAYGIQVGNRISNGQIKPDIIWTFKGTEYPYIEKHKHLYMITQLNQILNCPSNGPIQYTKYKMNTRPSSPIFHNAFPWNWVTPRRRHVQAKERDGSKFQRRSLKCLMIFVSVDPWISFSLDLSAYKHLCMRIYITVHI